MSAQVEASTPWDAERLARDLPSFEFEELADPVRALQWLDALAEFGATLTSDVPPTYDGLRSVSDLIGIVHNTNYGVEWDIVAAKEPATLVDSDHPLRVHTDLPYRRLPPGVQLLLSAEAEAEGGNTLLVDGYLVADLLAGGDPEAFAQLTSTERAFAYVNETQRYIGGGPIIGLRRDGTADVIRHAPDLILPLRDDEQQHHADRALVAFMEICSRPEVMAQIRLEPGDLLAFNNHRVMHGRGPVDLSTGPRRLLGCYGSLDELASARRVGARALGR